MLDEQMEGCAFSKGNSLCYRKKNTYFLSPLFGIFDFFIFFNFSKSLKKNKRMLRYKGGTSVARNHTSSKCKEHTNAQSKETCRKRALGENSSMGQGVRSQRQSATRLAYKACFKGSVERNMEPTLGQRHIDANAIKK
jgi:hypothetical protein